MKKIVMLFVLVALIVGGVFVYQNFWGYVKPQIEKIASEALTVPVRISDVDISLSDKKVTVTGLRIANPPGYKKSHAVEVGSISVALAKIPENFDLIRFSNIEVRDTTVNLEVSEKGTNLNDLKKRMDAQPKGKSNVKQPKVILDRFHINPSSLNPAVTLLGGDLGTVKIPQVTLTGIGTRENGVLAKDAIKQILTQYMGVAQKSANKAGYLKGMDTEILTKTKQKVDDTVNKIGKSIGGFLGN